jgi:hypothetical protein
MSEWTVVWNHGEVQDIVNSMSELDALLDRIHNATAQDRLNDIVIVSPTGDNIAIVMGASETVLSWISADGDPPYFASRGESEKIEPVFTCFLYGSEHTEYARRNVIPTERGREALRNFFATGKRPSNIEWEEV